MTSQSSYLTRERSSPSMLPTPRDRPCRGHRQVVDPEHVRQSRGEKVGQVARLARGWQLGTEVSGASRKRARGEHQMDEDPEHLQTEDRARPAAPARTGEY